VALGAAALKRDEALAIGRQDGDEIRSRRQGLHLHRGRPPHDHQQVGLARLTLDVAVEPRHAGHRVRQRFGERGGQHGVGGLRAIARHLARATAASEPSRDKA